MQKTHDLVDSAILSLLKLAYPQSITDLRWQLAGSKVSGYFMGAGTPYRFTVASDGLSYQPVARLPRADSQARGKRTEKNKCAGKTSYPCGLSCINENKECRLRSPKVRAASATVLSRAKQSEAGRQTASISEAELQKRIAQSEAKIRNLEYERAIIIDKRTGRELLNKGGSSSEVSFTPEEVKKMKGQVLTHNHPNLLKATSGEQLKGYSFSESDVQIACVAQMGEIRAVSHGYTHSLKPPRSGWDEQFYRREVEPSYRRSISAASKELVWEFSRGKITAADAEVEVHHRTWQKVAKDTGIQYRRTPYRG